MTNISAALRETFDARLKENEFMSKHTNFRIGGAARWYVDVKSEEELLFALNLATKEDVPWFILGGGSNTLVSDEGFDGLVMQMAMRAITIEGNRVTAEAGVLSAALARKTAEAGLAGFSWAISLPGTIGGAIRGNAGCFGGEAKDCLISVHVLSFADESWKTKEIPVEMCGFGYRESVFKHSGDIILSATYAFPSGDREELLASQQNHLASRKATQPLYAGSAGCVFKNSDVAEDVLQRLRQEVDIPLEMNASRKLSSGWLIDQLDLKGTRIGDAEISQEHGNFIVNRGAATASDVVQLIALAKTRARNHFGIVLQEEVRYLGF